MRVTWKGLVGDDRLTDAELLALQVRLSGESQDRREHGAMTVADVAEGAGTTGEHVLEHLRRLRAEQAFDVPARRPFQIPMWAAGGLLVVAIGFAAWRILGPTIQRSHDEQMASRIIDSAAQRRARKIAANPSEKFKQLDPQQMNAPSGFIMKMYQGSSGVSVTNPLPAAPMDGKRLEAQLRECIKRCLAEAHDVPDLSGPQAPRELQITWSCFGTRAENKIVFTAGYGQTEGDFRGVQDRGIERVATQIFSSLAYHSRPIPDPRHYPEFAPPPGFDVEFNSTFFKAKPIAVLPVDVSTYQDLMRSFLACKFETLEGRQTHYPEAAGAPAPPTLPVSVHIQITGPVSSFGFDVPEVISKEHPTEKDLAQARTRLIDDALQRIGAQLTQLNQESTR